MRHILYNQRGFSLIELIVSVAIFTVVMVLALGSLLAVSAGERKAETLKSVMNNLNFTLDSMTRFMRTGKDYHCATPTGGDCAASGSTYIAFTAAPRSFPICTAGTTCYVAYCLDNGVIEREVTTGALDSSCSGSVAGFLPITAPEVNISDLKFYVLGSLPYPPAGSTCASPPVGTDCIQPKVTVTLFGSVQVNAMASTTFNLQTTVTQRLYDQ